LIEAMGSRVGPEHYGEKRRESAEAKADGLWGGIKKVAVDGADSGTAAQDRHEESRSDGACASRDGDDGRLDRATVADGNQSASDALVVLEQAERKMTAGVVNTKN